jgi:hypothetical protein
MLAADAAPAYAAGLGWPVLPLWWAEDGRCACGKPDCDKPGKHPLGLLAPKGVKNATTDLAQLAAWRRRFPRHNIGIACTGFWVLDPDGQAGLDALADLEDRYRWLPLCPASITGRGGVHLLFAGDARVKNWSPSRLGAKLDTRSVGGFFVAPPSMHENGSTYCWLPGRDPWSVAPPPAPTWLLDLLEPPRPSFIRPSARVPARAHGRYVERAVRQELRNVALAGEGARNTTLFRAAASLARFVAAGSLDARDIGPALVDAALAAGLPRSEAERTTVSGLKTALRGGAG